MSLQSLHTLSILLLSLCPGCGNSSGILTPPPPPPASADVRLSEVTHEVGFPVFVTAPPGDQHRVFIVDKGGRIRIVKNGVLLAGPFLDISNRVSGGDEQGLLGLAFHPNYAGNGRFVVDYTNTAGDTRVAVFRVSANPDVADPASEQVVLSIPQPFSNHNGGMVVFGPDGKLYIGTGDGGSGGDPQGNAQNRNSLLGKLLRVSLDDNGLLSIPPDNPFVGEPGVRGEIWSYGLRNPWRFSFDRSTGDLYIADVGQSTREEVDIATPALNRGKGLNFGWNVMEGTACYDSSSCNRTGLTLPVLDYTHADGCSITGGYVYRGAALPALAGRYFYSDWCSGWVRSFRFSNGTAADPQDWPTLQPGGGVASFGEDGRGELYLMTGSAVYRIVPAS